VIIDGPVVADPESLADLGIAWPDPMDRILVKIINIHSKIPG
jgi:hypothetical protein